MNCADPIDAAALTDYWFGGLPNPEEEAVEEHLLRCDPCGERLREVLGLAEGVRKLAREGSLRMIVSDIFLQLAAAEGRRIREYTVSAGDTVQCTVTAEDDLLIGRLAANLSGAKRVDMCLCDERGVERLRLEDIPVNPETSSIVYQESITFAKAMPSNRMIVRLVTADERGGDRWLGEYTFNHTRSLPG